MYQRLVHTNGGIYNFYRSESGEGHWTYAGGRRVGSSIVGVIVSKNLAHELTEEAVRQGLGTARDFSLSTPRKKKIKKVRVSGTRTSKKKTALIGSFNPFDKTELDKVIEEKESLKKEESLKAVGVRRKKSAQKGFFDSFFDCEEPGETTEELSFEEIEPEIISGEY